MIVGIMSSDQRETALRQHMQRAMLENCKRDAFEAAMILHLAIIDLEECDPGAALFQLECWDSDVAPPRTPEVSQEEGPF